MAAMESYGNIGLFYRDFETPAAWHKVKNVKSINGPGEETAFNDATDFDSPGGKREYRPGLIDPGSLECTANYKPGDASWAFLAAAQKNRKRVTFRLITCDADTGDRECEEFEAYVQSKSRNAEVDGFMEGNLAMRITGDTDPDADAYPTIKVAVSPTTLTEGGSPSVATFTITLDREDIKPVTVDLAWSGTATNVSDYTRPAATSVTIEPGDTTATLQVSIVNDASVETAETVILTIDAEIDGETLTATPGGSLTATLTLNSEDV